MRAAELKRPLLRDSCITISIDRQNPIETFTIEHIPKAEAYDVGGVKMLESAVRVTTRDKAGNVAELTYSKDGFVTLMKWWAELAGSWPD